jgi:hypothetical protein
LLASNNLGEIRSLIMSAALATLTAAHVLVSLIGLGSGFVVLWGLLRNRLVEGWTAVFLTTTIATSASGFLFPVDPLTPGQIIGIVSLFVLGVAVFALYQKQLAGWWRTTYVISGVTAQYLNFFVLIVQLFAKVPALKALAPTQTEPPFAVAQIVTLLAFVGVGALAAVRFRDGRGSDALSNRFAKNQLASGHSTSS